MNVLLPPHLYPGDGFYVIDGNETCFNIKTGRLPFRTKTIFILCKNKFIIPGLRENFLRPNSRKDKTMFKLKIKIA